MLSSFIKEIQELCRPDKVHLCDGSEAEFHYLLDTMQKNGMAIPLKREGSWYFHTDPDDLARVEERTFICSEDQDDAGPTNNWMEPKVMKEKLIQLFSHCMRGRTMYVVPYSMGPIGSKYAKLGVEITDSPYVVCNMKIMTRMGVDALSEIEKGKEFVAGIHSVGKPLQPGEKDMFWPCNPEKYIVHFPKLREIWSFGSGYGGNALLGKKCFALRIASCMAREEGWLAEHMLIIGLTNPQGQTKYFAAAFPSSCGKTNLAMMRPTIPGWKVSTIGDDIAWMHFEEDGKLYAINPEAGLFGIAPGTSEESNPYAMKTIEKNTLFTNVALTKDRDVWWEGMTKVPPEGLTDWQGKPWKPGSTPSAHPNARFTVSIEECPIFEKTTKGVPIEGIIFGGRRRELMPLVVEAPTWTRGVLFGASLSSERTSAAKGDVGTLRHDPFAMLPFCGYHMGDYFQHWLDLEQKGRTLPKIFAVNWFRKDENGRFLWPGFGENAKVLKWCFERISGSSNAIETPIGIMPKDFPADRRLFEVDVPGFQKEARELRDYFAHFGKKFPRKLTLELDRLEQSLISHIWY